MATVERTTRGFSVLSVPRAISHHFQALTDQGLLWTMLEYVGLCWVIFGFDGYNMVTVETRIGNTASNPFSDKTR